jgi:hypothetical protein
MLWEGVNTNVPVDLYIYISQKNTMDYIPTKNVVIYVYIYTVKPHDLQLEP